MSANMLELGEAYLTAWNDKDIQGIAKYIHPKVHFKDPMAEFTDRDSYLGSCERIFPMLKEIRIRSTSTSGNQVIFIYDLIFPAPISVCVRLWSC